MQEEADWLSVWGERIESERVGSGVYHECSHRSHNPPLPTSCRMAGNDAETSVCTLRQTGQADFDCRRRRNGVGANGNGDKVATSSGGLSRS